MNTTRGEGLALSSLFYSLKATSEGDFHWRIIREFLEKMQKIYSIRELLENEIFYFCL